MMWQIKKIIGPIHHLGVTKAMASGEFMINMFGQTFYFVNIFMWVICCNSMTDFKIPDAKSYAESYEGLEYMYVIAPIHRTYTVTHPVLCRVYCEPMLFCNCALHMK